MTLSTREIYTLSLHDALPIFAWRSGKQSAIEGAKANRIYEIDEASASSPSPPSGERARVRGQNIAQAATRSEEHTSELQSPYDLVCRLLLEKKKNNTHT